jgi:hypothetical protein
VTIEDVALANQRRARLRAGLTANKVLAQWETMDPRNIGGSWAHIAPAVYLLVANAQANAAAEADPYLVKVAAANEAVSITEAPVSPAGFTGVASDGRTLQGALLTGPVTALQSISAGMPPADALLAGGAALKAMVTTQVADANRVATQLSMFMRTPDVLPDGVTKGPGGRLFATDGKGRQRPYFRPRFYVRMVNPGACNRCIILAGVRYRRAQAFNRHPGCGCTHIPVDENLDDVAPTDPKVFFDSLSPGEQDKKFGKAGAEAIRMGADMNQVVNARRGVSYAGVSADGTRRGQKLLNPYTTEGVTKRGLYGVTQSSFKKTSESRYTRAATARLMPEEIIRRAGSREEAIRLLRQNAFIF